MNRIIRNSLFAAFALSLIFPFRLAKGADWVKKESSTRPFIGIYPQTIDHDKREALDFKGDGVLVEDVVSDGPAQKAGIKPGDIITKIDGDKIEDESDFRAAIRDHEPGDKVKVSVVRDGLKQEIEVTLVERTSKSVEINLPSMSWSSEGKDRAFLGVESMTLDGQLADYFGAKEGALIQKVVEGSAAEKAGLKAGDVVTKIGDDIVGGSDGLREAIGNHKPGETVEIKLLRKGVEMTLTAILSKTADADEDSESRSKIIIRHGEDLNIDMDEMREAIREAMDEVQINLHDGRDELKDEIADLKKQVEELRKQMNGKRDEKKAEKKEEQKKN